MAAMANQSWAVAGGGEAGTGGAGAVPLRSAQMMEQQKNGRWSAAGAVSYKNIYKGRTANTRTERRAAEKSNINYTLRRLKGKRIMSLIRVLVPVIPVRICSSENLYFIQIGSGRTAFCAVIHHQLIPHFGKIIKTARFCLQQSK